MKKELLQISYTAGGFEIFLDQQKGVVLRYAVKGGLVVR